MHKARFYAVLLRVIIANMFDLLFHCWHQKYSFPITVKGAKRYDSDAARHTGTYVACLKCGKDLPYDWDTMKVLSEADLHRKYNQPLELMLPAEEKPWLN